MKIRYYSTRRAWKGSRATWGYWVPSKKMKAAGFAMVCCGEDGPRAWSIAEQWNSRWDQAKAQLRSGLTPTDPDKIERVFPPGSLGEAFARYRSLNTWSSGKKVRTREDWLRGWKHIEPVFGDVDPATVTLEDLDGWYAALLATISVREAYRAMKIWRALWKKAGTLKKASGERYCDSKNDPSLGVTRQTPEPRDAIWFEGEAVRLTKRAWRLGYRGLAAALAVAWDTMLSPVDVRALSLSQLSPDTLGGMFSVERAKTGKAAIGTLSKRTRKLLEAYIAGLPFTLMPDTPIFHTRGFTPSGRPGIKGKWGGDHGGGKPQSPRPYTKDTLTKDFRIVRQAEFPGETRKISDLRRSGAIEATAGGVDPAALAGKMANSIDTNRELQETYLPQNATLVRLADKARTVGRGRMRGANAPGTKS